MVAFEGEDWLAGGRVPDLDGFVRAVRDKPCPVGTERRPPALILGFEGDEVVALTQAVEVIPFPAALAGRAAIEQFFHLADVAVPPQVVRPGNVMVILVPFRFLLLFFR